MINIIKNLKGGVLRLNHIDKVIVIVCLYYLYMLIKRMFLSVELTDEIYYLTSAYQLFNGASPIGGVWSVLSTSSIFILPFFYVFKIFSPDFTGIVVFMRLVYLCYMFLFSWFIKSVLSNYTSTKNAILLSIVPLFFVYLNLPQLSYNTLSITLFSAGVILFWHCNEQNYSNDRNLFLSGLLTLLACFCYPTLLLAFPFLLELLYIRSKRQEKKILKRRLLLYTFGYLVPGLLLVLSIMVWSGLDNFIQGMKFTLNSHNFDIYYRKTIGEFSYFTYIFEAIKSKGLIVPFTLVLISGIVLLIYLAKRKNKSSELVNAVVIVLIGACALFFLAPGLWIVMKQYYFYTAILIVVLYLTFLIDKMRSLNMFVFIYIPSLILYCARFYSSNNPWLIIQSSSLFILMIFSISIILIEMEKVDNRKNGVSIVLLSLILCGIGLIQFYGYIYRDDKASELNSMVSSGIYKGCLTTEIRKDSIERIQIEIDSQISEYDTIMIPSRFTAGYLMSKAKIHSPDTWSLILENYNVNSVKRINQYNEYKEKKPSKIVIVEWHGSEFKLEDDKNELNIMLKNEYEEYYTSNINDYFNLHIFRLN